MLLIIQTKRYLISLVLSLPNLLGQSRKKELDYPVKSDADLHEESLRPYNDNHWNRIRYE